MSSIGVVAQPKLPGHSFLPSAVRVGPVKTTGPHSEHGSVKVEPKTGSGPGNTENSVGFMRPFAFMAGLRQDGSPPDEATLRRSLLAAVVGRCVGKPAVRHGGRCNEPDIRRGRLRGVVG
jgi:hypothetical protein